MRTLLFIGHSHHSLTQSSGFFKEALKASYQLSELSISPSDNIEVNLTKLTSLDFGDYAGVVLWQIDYLASFFLARGIPVIVCPMYDSSSSLEPNHWRAMEQSLIICFSLELQFLLAKAGVDSLYIKYFPGLAANHDSLLAASESADRSPLHVFFWERLPDSDINTDRILGLLSGINVGHLHIHQAADPGRTPNKIDHEFNNFMISTSTWFNDKSEYLQMLDSTDIFIAPRYAEGIGMSFLEAMAHGCCVIAHDMPTHNEYITNWKDGILVDYKDPSMEIHASSEEIRGMARHALQNAEIHAKNWNNFYCPLMLESVAKYLDNFRKEPSIDLVSNSAMLLELKALCAAHSDWDSYYEHINIICGACGAVSVPDQSNGSFMPIVNRLVSYGRLSEAIDILDSAIERDRESGKIYSLVKNQLIERIRLKKSRKPSI
jgi:hypothetical protein